MTNTKVTDRVAGHEIAGHENGGPNSRTWKCKTLRHEIDGPSCWAKGATTGGSGVRTPQLSGRPQLLTPRFCRGVHRQASRVNLVYNTEEERRNSSCYYCRYYPLFIARYWYSNSVRPSLRPSVRNVLVLDENGLTHRHSFFHHTVAQSF